MIISKLDGVLRMGEKIKVFIPSPDGQAKEAIGELMNIIEAKEPWSEYLLEDGTKIRVRQSVVSITKTDLKNQDSIPIYVVQSQPLVLTIPTE
jgi:hypothetical protein